MLNRNLLNFLNGIIHILSLELSILFLGYQDEDLKFVSQQYRPWTNCTDVLAWLYTDGKG